MKKFILPLFVVMGLLLSAQNKRPSLALHYSFTDFQTAMNVKANGFGSTLKNGQWSKLPDMDAGYGLSYWQGVSSFIDLIGGLNYTKSIYTFPIGGYTTTRNMLTLEASGAFKPIPERKAAVTPYLATGVGFYNNAGNSGFYMPFSIGIHANLWKESFVFSAISYRQAFSQNVNNSFYYQIGVGTHLTREKVEKPKPIEPIVVVEEVKPVLKDVMIWVKDEATGQPLPDVELTLTSVDGGKVKGNTDKDGVFIFPKVLKGVYSLQGKLNNIDTEKKMLPAEQFDKNEATIALILLHNDPRFTLVGNAIDKNAGNPVNDVVVTVNNKTQASVAMTRSQANGQFKVQLEAASDFSVSGKKSGYFSNIEEVSTKGLSRSATLYVKLELEIQEAKQGQQIVLNKIFFETGKANLNTSASTDLNRLVKYMQDNATSRLEIQGHTDNTGSISTNNRLSQNRANAVVNYLVSQGVALSRLTAKGYGSSKPIDSNTSPEGRANNRRVEIKILGE